MKLPISTLEMGDPTWGMRPAGAGRSSPPNPVVDLSNVRENAVGRSLSVEAPEFSTGDNWIRGHVQRCWDYGPVDVAGLSVPVVAGMKFAAVNSGVMVVGIPGGLLGWWIGP